MAVGFLDLVGSTALASRLEFAELGAVLREFEAAVSDTIVRHRGRVVKFIGDEVMFTTRTAASGLEAAVALSELFKQHPRIPPVRVGLAFGPVLTREGDCFGSVVNLAARIVTVAEPDSILIESTLRAQLSAPEWEFEDAGSSFLKGFNSPVSLFRVARHISGADIDSTPARPKPLTPGRCPSTGTRSWRQESHSERLVQRGRIGKKVEPWKSEIC